MSSEILVSPDYLHELITAGDCLVVDCRFDFSTVNKGRNDWLAGHIPGAHYAHLDNDLAAPVTVRSGRHPLPETGAFAGFLASLGWSEGQLVVAYDARSNALAGRMWWLMRYFGQPAALLDGGLAAWKETGLPLETGPVVSRRVPVPCLQAISTMAVSSDQVLKNLESKDNIVLDARSPERYSGQNELLDAKGGHIPGSVNRYLQLNLTLNGQFKDPATLRSEFEALLGETAAAAIVHSCGSGVTACHNLFAMELAGMGTGRLYPGSWSEWIRKPSRPITTGN
ncbi:MAG: sulfurtransferase [Xanthomonadales bacterium]